MTQCTCFNFLFPPYHRFSRLCTYPPNSHVATQDSHRQANGRGVFIHQGRDKYVDPEVVAKMEDTREISGPQRRSHARCDSLPVYVDL